jgi:aldose sugar dehydrogenase
MFHIIYNPSAGAIRMILIFSVLLTSLFTLFIALFLVDYSFVFADVSRPKEDAEQTISEANLKIEVVSKMEFEEEKNDASPVSSMAFLGSNDILLLEKNNGLVHRVVNGELLEDSLLDVAVANERERGLLGIAVAHNASSNNTYVYLYFTESAGEDGEDNCPPPDYKCKLGADPLGNRLYRYELVNNRLVNPKLLLDLPADPGPVHNGGVIRIGPDSNIYLITGDLVNVGNISFYNKAHNNENGATGDGRSGILRVTQDGMAIGKGILGSEYPLNFYYAYGIRNGFGIDFDPVTGNLWDTENGPNYGDEINLVEPGFNSGWNRVQGFWEDNEGYIGDDVQSSPEGLVSLGGKGKYSSPELTMNFTVAFTALVFLDSKMLGKEYENDLFVAANNNGKIYHFDLNNNRNSLELHDLLADKIANSTKELKDVEFASGFGEITDLEMGPDGYLYVLSHTGREATISRIVPASS